MSVTRSSDAYGSTGSTSGDQPTAGSGYGSVPGSGATLAGVPPSRWGTVGLGVLTAVVVFGVTLALLMSFANPRAPTPAAAVPMASGVTPGAPHAAGTPSPAAPGVVVPMAEPAVEDPGAPASTTTHGELAIKAEPAGAEVRVDGRSMGNAPFEGVLEVGQHQIELRADGFQPWASQVEVVRGERQTLNIVLSKTEGAKVDVSRRRSKRSSAKKKSGDKSDASSEDESTGEAPTPEPPRKLDRGDTTFKKLDRDAGPGFKKLGSGGGEIKKLGQ